MKAMRVRAMAALSGVLALGVVGCSGDYGGRSDGVSGGSGGTQARSMEEHFSGNVQPTLDFCRTCHIPKGIADVEDGHDFMLSTDKSKDLSNLKTSWERLGGNNPTSRILLMSSGQETPHTGGKPWPQGSAQYKNMEILLKCFESPSGCTALLAGSIGGGALLPLLAEGHRGGHAWSRFCEGEADGNVKADTAMLPVDPVTLIKPGINAGKAVYFNAWYKDCHVNAKPEDQAPKTCGDWRRRIARGANLMEGNGAIGFGATGGVDAAAYNRLWMGWGLPGRPANFDQLVAQRWGTPLPQVRNPYPLPGEDPNTTNGGSGQLPAVFSQEREADGTWTGKLAATCHACHSGQIGLPGEPNVPGVIFGTNGLADIGVWGRDMLSVGATGQFQYPLLTKVRGTGNITNFQLFLLLLKPTPQQILSWLPTNLSGSTGTEDPPVWWNLGHRPLKFYDGGMASDSQRITISGYDPGPTDPGARDFIELHDQDAVAWISNLRSPKFPLPIDTALAEQGAILFHSKDLFALPENDGHERPKGGNGSCAGCHGAYSPRFVHDKNYLEKPELEGIAGYIVPRDLIGTDPRRVDGNDQTVARGFEDNWYGYPEQVGTENDCGDQNNDRIRGDRENGYLAPPLYGVWASAPYFHNGSVPKIWEVLKSSERKPIWRRVSAPNDKGLNVVMGFDPSFQRAYDKEKLGWKYDEIPCELGGAVPYVQCNPADPQANPLLEQVLSAVYANGGLIWNVSNLLYFPLTDADIERRKIYSTRMYSQDNGGHTFTDALTDPERRAIIEYLKTL